MMIENQSILKKERMDCESDRDLLSELPLSIIHIILALVPFSDAVGTSLLSRRWRYTWTSLPYLIFEDECESLDGNIRNRYHERMQNVITHALFRHNGPIQKFKLSISFRDSCPTIDAWVHCLSRNGIRELILDMGYSNSFPMMHSSIYSCNELTYLELFYFILDPPPSTFKGFLFLKCLILFAVSLSPDEIESLVAKSPLLKRFELIEYDNPKLRISAPNLKYLDLTGEYIELCLYAPLLSEMLVKLHEDDFTAEHSQQKISVCNYTNFFAGITNLDKLSGCSNFIKYLSIGIESCDHSFVLHHLKVIKLKDIDFEDIKEVSAVVRLINGAPNLQELEITTNYIIGGDDALEAATFRDFGCAPHFTFEKLRVVKIYGVSGLPLLMEFIKFLLESSPLLERMSARVRMEEEKNLRAELLGCSRASPDAKLSIYS